MRDIGLSSNEAPNLSRSTIAQDSRTPGVPTEGDPNINGFSSVELAMVNEATNAFGGSDGIRAGLNDLVRSAHNLKAILPEGSDVHCFISGKKMNSEEVHLFTLVSSTFHEALSSIRIGSTIVSQAIRDVFLLARQSNRDVAVRAPPVQTETRAVPDVVVPEWFPWSQIRADDVTATRPTYIFCRERIMSEFRQLDINQVAHIYSTFFQALWAKGYEEGRVMKNANYAKLTPPWLRKPVTFMHGANRSMSLPFVLRVLPNKNQIRHRNGKVLASAILDAWMKNDPTAIPFITHLIRQKRPDADLNGDESSSYMDLTGAVSPTDTPIRFPNSLVDTSAGVDRTGFRGDNSNDSHFNAIGEPSADINRASYATNSNDTRNIGVDNALSSLPNSGPEGNNTNGVHNTTGINIGAAHARRDTAEINSNHGRNNSVIDAINAGTDRNIHASNESILIQNGNVPETNSNDAHDTNKSH